MTPDGKSKGGRTKKMAVPVGSLWCVGIGGKSKEDSEACSR